MNVVIRPNEDEVAHYAYDLLRDRIIHEQAKVLGLPTGSTPLKLYADCKGFKRRNRLLTSIPSMDEYYRLRSPPELRYFMEENLLGILIEIRNTTRCMTDDICPECED